MLGSNALRTLHASALSCLLFAASSSAQPSATRQIRFTTDEGTWISLDVSPDGGTIAFELLGDIYTMPASGGPARLLISGPAFESQPRYSPDGRSIAYVSDGTGSDNVLVASADGSHARAVTSFPRSTVLSPAWSRDGRTLYATVIEQREASLWRIDVATGKRDKILSNTNGPAAPLVSSPAPGPYGAEPAPDGSIYFASVTPRPYGSRNGASSVIARLDAASGKPDPLRLGEPVAMKPRLSPDGRLLCFGAQAQGRTGLRIRDLETGDERWLRFPLQRSGLESFASRDVLPDYAFTPDGKAVIIAYDGKIHRIELNSSLDTVIPFSAPVSMDVPAPLAFPRRVEQGPVRARMVQQAAVGPDGRVAYSALGRLWIADASGNSARRLTTTARPHEFMPAWSPDGKWIAFVTWSSEGGHLWKIPSDGGAAPVRISGKSAFWIDPVWTPDGRSIVALRAPEGSARTSPGMAFPDQRLVIVPALGAGPETTLSREPNLRHPHFARDASRVYVSTPEGLVSMKLDGSERVLHAKLARAADVRVAPDGARAAGLVDGRLVDFPLPAPDPVTPKPGAVEAGPGAASLGWSPAAGSPYWVTGATLHVASSPSAGVPLSASVPRSAPPNGASLVLRNARAITMRGDEIIDQADIVITGNRIAAIGKRGSVTVPPGARIIDIAGKTIMPGIVDIHSHWGPLRAELLEPEIPQTYANLAFGVTTVRDPQIGPEIFSYADLVETGEVPSPRIYSTGPGIFTNTNFQSLDQARRLLSRYRDEFGTHLLKSYMVGNRQQRRWVVEASRELKMIPTTEGGSDSKMNITHVLDGFSGNEHALPTAPLYRDVVQLFAQSGIVYTPTLLVSFGAALPIYKLHAEQRPFDDPKLRRFFPLDDLYQRTSTRLLAFPEEDYNYREVAAGANAILEAGGRVALGGHGEMQGLQVHWEMRLLSEGGMRPHDVLRVATKNGADAIGFGEDLGSLEAGKLADLIVLDRNPLDDLRATTSIRYVIKNGFLYQGDTLAAVWPASRPLEAPWWQRQQQQNAATPESAIDAIARDAMDSMRIPGLAIAVLKGNNVLLSKGYGLANLEQAVPVTPQTMFESGSIGKQFTAALVMSLVEAGRMKLTDSIRAYLPDAPPDWQPITIRHLLSHTSGIPDYTGDALDYRRDYTEDQLAKLAYNLKLEFPAGARWNYSNTGYAMLGVVLSKVTGAPYWQALRERIFTPAGMPHIRIISESEIVPHRAASYMVPNGEFRNQDWVSPTLNTTADGSLLLSLDDLIAWMRVVRNRTLLSRESWDELMSPITLNSGRTYPYGHGWFLETLNGGKVEQHGGSWQGFQTQLSRFEAGDLSVIVLANSRTALVGDVANSVAAAVDAALQRPAPPSSPISGSDPNVEALLRRTLEKTARGELGLADFEFVRQTIVGRMSAAYRRLLEPLGALQTLELLDRGEEGDDRIYVYRATFANGPLRVTVKIGPGGGLTGLQLARMEPR